MSVVLVNPGATATNSAVGIQEIDGTPLVPNINIIKITDGTLTDNGDGSVTMAVSSSAATGNVNGAASSVDGEVALFSGTGGKTLKRWNQSGLLKSSAGILQAATAGTDYPAATVGAAILRGDSAGGFTNTVANVDYQLPIGTISGLAKGNGANALVAATVRVDYAEPTTALSTGILKNTTGTGTHSIASPGTDYLLPNGNGSQLTNLTKTQVGLGNVDNTSDANKPVSSAAQTALDLKAPKAFPIFTGDVRSTFLGTENFIIDARTNPRTMTAGVIRLNHTAGMTGTRPITLDIDCNGYTDTHAMVFDYRVTGVASGDMHLLGITVDTANSTGGDVHGISVGKIGSGLAAVTAMEVYTGCDVIAQHVGTLQTLTQAWTLSGAVYTDVTAAFTNGTNVDIFANDGDYVICGYDAAFDHLEVSLQTLASVSITPVFEYSTGVGTWSAFSPADGSNGFTTNGTIAWSTLAGWISAAVNGVSKYYIRIQRTRNQVTTTPVENGITIVSSPQHYTWDKNGDLTIRRINTKSALVYADNAAAIAAGLTEGQVYRTAIGHLMVVY